jgi:hypothetical protein
MKHEYYHLERYCAAPGAFTKGLKSHQTKAKEEFLAYASQIRNSKTTGVFKRHSKMEDLGGRLEWEGYSKMANKDQEANEALYEECQRILKDAVPGWKPPSKREHDMTIYPG